MTLSEIILWEHLRQKQMMGVTFQRQRPILEYIVDFYCKELLLVIEIDGSSHDLDEGEDMIRQKQIEQLGVSFLRFTDAEVKQDLKHVLHQIEAYIVENKELSNEDSFSVMDD